MTHHTVGATAAANEAVSPELVLVDPNLAERARSSLPPPVDTLGRLAALVPAHPPAAPAAPAPHPPAESPAQVPLPPPPAISWGSRPRSSRARSALLAGGVAAVLAISLLVGVRIDVSGQPAGADSTTVRATAPSGAKGSKASSTKSSPADRPRSRPKANPPAASRSSSPTRHRFAWAPTRGATGYDVEFFRDGTRVYAGHTTQSTIEIPARWQYEGAAHSFHAGEYTWYVWPDVGGQRAARASVQTTVSIAHS